MSGEVIPFQKIEQDNEPNHTLIDEPLVLTLEQANYLFMSGYEEGYNACRKELKDLLEILRAKN